LPAGHIHQVKLGWRHRIGAVDVLGASIHGPACRLFIRPVATILGVLLARRISKRLGRSLPCAFLMGVAGVSTMAPYLLQPRQGVLMLVLQAIASFAMGHVSMLRWAIFTGAADYREWKTGHRNVDSARTLAPR
jgi:Na+/melibiose symporter-like transporter